MKTVRRGALMRYVPIRLLALVPLIVLLFDLYLHPALVEARQQLNSASINTLLTARMLQLGRYRGHDVRISLG